MLNSPLYYRFSEDGYFENAVNAAPDPLATKKAGHPVFIQPRDSTPDKPEGEEGTWPRWNGASWDYVALPTNLDELVAFGKIKHDQQTAFWARLNQIKNELLEGADRYKQELKDGYWEVCRLPDPTPEELAAKARSEAKTQRATEVVEVERKNTDGVVEKILTFDGDEESQTRIGRSVAAAIAKGEDPDTTMRTWVMADNSIEEVSISELAEALEKAGAIQTDLWVVSNS